LIIGSIIRDLIRLTKYRIRNQSFPGGTNTGCNITHSIDIANNSRYTGKSRTSTGYNADVLECILALFILAISVVIEVGNSLAKGLKETVRISFELKSGVRKAHL
jgi:hypothetical protein